MTEGDAGSTTKVVITAALSAAAAEERRIPLTFDGSATSGVAGSATSATDYTFTSPSTITIAKGDTKGTLSLTILGDIAAEVERRALDWRKLRADTATVTIT